MALLSPIRETGEETPAQIQAKELVIANEILRESGLQELAADKEECAKILDEIGYSLTDSLRDLTVMAKFSDNDGIRLRAIETTLQLRNKLGNGRKHETDSRGVTFVLNGENVQLNSLLNPQR